MADFGASAAVVGRPTTGTAWDYSVISIHSRHNDGLEQQLKELGRDGWELIYVNMPLANEYQCIFRRPLN